MVDTLAIVTEGFLSSGTINPPSGPDGFIPVSEIKAEMLDRSVNVETYGKSALVQVREKRLTLGPARLTVEAFFRN